VGRVRIEARKSTWETPMANKVTHVAIALRESMEELGWTFERERSERIYSRFAIVMPMPKVAYVFRFVVTPGEVAGLVFEPLLGAGGYVSPPDEYWPRAREFCDEHGILMIDDEVQTGFGRTGRMWACQHWDVVPDIMCMSKAVAAGLPMGVCAAKGEVMDWDEGAHENTLGGNPIIASAASAVIDVLTEERLWLNAAKVGEHIKRRLTEAQDEAEIIGDVRGKGLMIGLELVKDRETKEPAAEERDQTIIDAFKKGLLLLAAGPCSIRLAPPLILMEEQADSGVDILLDVLKNV